MSLIDETNIRFILLKQAKDSTFFTPKHQKNGKQEAFGCKEATLTAANIAELLLNRYLRTRFTKSTQLKKQKKQQGNEHTQSMLYRLYNPRQSSNP